MLGHMIRKPRHRIAAAVLFGALLAGGLAALLLG